MNHKTTWIRQGLAKYQCVELGVKNTNNIVDSLSEIKNIL